MTTHKQALLVTTGIVLLCAFIWWILGIIFDAYGGVSIVIFWGLILIGLLYAAVYRSIEQDRKWRDKS